MKLRKYAVVVAMLGLSAPVLAQSSGSGWPHMSSNMGPTSANETAGASVAGSIGQGGGSADVNTSRPRSHNRATRQERANQRQSDRNQSGMGMGATSGSDRSQSGMGMGSTSGSDRSHSGMGMGSTSGTAGAGGNIGATGVNETAGNSSSGVKAQGSGTGGADMGSNR